MPLPAVSVPVEESPALVRQITGLLDDVELYLGDLAKAHRLNATEANRHLDGLRRSVKAIGGTDTPETT